MLLVGSDWDSGVAFNRITPEKRSLFVACNHKRQLRVCAAALALFCASSSLLPSYAQNQVTPVSAGSDATSGAAGTIQTSSMPAPLIHGKVESKPSFPIASGFSRLMQKVTGLTFASQIVTELVAARVAEKKLGGRCKVKVRLYSFTDLLAGKVKTVSIKARQCSLKEVPVGQVVVSSEAPVWFDWHKRNGRVGGLSGAVNLSVVGELNQDDVCKALATEALTKSLRGLRLDLPGLGEQQLQILQPKVSLDDKRITIDALLITKDASPETGVNLTISAVPVLEGSKIMLTETRVSCPDILDPANFAIFTQDLFNPIVDFGKFDRTDHAFRLSKFVVERGRVLGSGNLLLVPRSHIAGTTAGSAQPVK